MSELIRKGKSVIALQLFSFGPLLIIVNNYNAAPIYGYLIIQNRMSKGGRRQMDNYQTSKLLFYNNKNNKRYCIFL